MAKIVSVFPINELGEIVAIAGVGTTNITEWIAEYNC